MPELKLVRAEHARAILEFETINRDYFAALISDRGDAFFENFSDRFASLLDAQKRGEDAYYVLLADDGVVIGRFNLFEIEGGGAHVGYRVAETAAGRGVATAAVGELCRVAAREHKLVMLRAAVSDANLASRRVVLANGFVLAGRADPSDLGGKTGSWFEKSLASSGTRGLG